MTKKDIIYLSTSIISIGIIILWIFLGFKGKSINSFFTQSKNIESIKNSSHIDNHTIRNPFIIPDSINQDSNIVNIHQLIDTSKETLGTIKETEFNNLPVIEEDKKYDVKYVYNGNENFRNGTIKIKKLLEESGHNYNKVKKEKIRLFIDESKKSINWNDACIIYLNKLKPKKGDYLYFIK